MNNLSDYVENMTYYSNKSRVKKSVILANATNKFVLLTSYCPPWMFPVLNRSLTDYAFNLLREERTLGIFRFCNDHFLCFIKWMCHLKRRQTHQRTIAPVINEEPKEVKINEFVLGPEIR